MQQKKELSKDDKTLVLIGGANTFFIVCKFLNNVVETIRENSLTRFFTPVSPPYRLAWVAFNVAVFWKFHEIGKERRCVQNTANGVINSAYSAVKSVGNFIQNTVAPPDTLIPSSTEVKIDMQVKKSNLDNACQNIAEGGGVVYDTIYSTMWPGR